MKTENIMTRKQIAHELDVSEKTVSRLFKQGRLPGAYKLGGETSAIRMKRADLSRVGRNDERKG